ncbi:hypothetical protein NDU88_007251, partial [Pleurodeles waltl]
SRGRKRDGVNKAGEAAEGGPSTSAKADGSAGPMPRPVATAPAPIQLWDWTRGASQRRQWQVV